MNTQVTTETLRQAVIEQAMRVTVEDSLVLPFLEAEPGSKAAHAALGRLLSEAAVRLVIGCPLIAFVSGSELNPAWRSGCASNENSLWSSLEFLEQIYGIVEGENPYMVLEKLRLLSEEEMTSLS